MFLSDRSLQQAGNKSDECQLPENGQRKPGSRKMASKTHHFTPDFRNILALRFSENDRVDVVCDKSPLLESKLSCRRNRVSSFGIDGQRVVADRVHRRLSRRLKILIDDNAS